MNKWIIVWCFIGLILIESAPQAREDSSDGKMPLGCSNTGFDYNLKTLKLFSERKQSLYLMHNPSNQTIQMFQMRQQDSSRSLFLNHTIEPYQWTALASNEPEISFICAIAKNNQSKIVDCSNYIKLCHYQDARFGLNNQGSFWLVNNSAKNGSVRDIVRYGIIPSRY